MTAPSDQASVAFHLALGFTPLRGDVAVAGLPTQLDHAGEGGQRVVFRRGVVHDATAAAAAGQAIAPGVDEALSA